MKMKKRIMGILLSIALVMGLIPSMSLTAYAEENHQIHNTISDIISLSITNTSHTQKGVKLSVYNVCGAKIPLCRRQLLRAGL